MKDLDFSTLTVEEAAKNSLLLSREQLVQQISNLTPEKVAAIIVVLKDPTEQDWRGKIRAFIFAMNDHSLLESAGRALDLVQSLEVLEQAIHVPGQHWKLLPLLVGMRPEVFSRLLLFIPPQQLHALKQEGLAEPVLHHLNVLVHELNKKLDDFLGEISNLEREIQSLDLKDLSRKSIASIIHKVERLHEAHAEILQKAEKGLSIAWNSDRVELIEELSHIKDMAFRQLEYIGQKRKASEKPFGLFSMLEARLNAVYGNASDPNDFEALKDDEPAFEALSKLSIWYLRDYWEAGLLPEIDDPAVLEQLDHAALTEGPLLQQRDRWLKAAEEKLKAFGIANVKDLKRAMIYSKKTLQEFIKACHDR